MTKLRINKTRRRSAARPQWKKEYGGELPEYALGDWLKQNAGTAVSVAGSIASVLPIPGASILGKAAQGIGGVMNTRQQEREAEEFELQRKREHIAGQRTVKMNELSNQIANQAAPNIPVFGFGGYMDYSGQDHGGPDGGIPVDAGGNPTTIAGTEPVGLVEDGESVYITPEGKPYVFSEELGFAKQARAIVNKYKRRLGPNLEKTHDQLARKGLERELDKLINKQEERRAQIGVTEEVSSEGLPQARHGGKLPVNAFRSAAPYGSEFQTMADEDLIGRTFRINGELVTVTDPDSAYIFNSRSPVQPHSSHEFHNRTWHHMNQAFGDHLSEQERQGIQNWIEQLSKSNEDVRENTLQRFINDPNEQEDVMRTIRTMTLDSRTKPHALKKGGYLPKYQWGGFSFDRNSGTRNDYYQNKYRFTNLPSTHLYDSTTRASDKYQFYDQSVSSPLSMSSSSTSMYDSVTRTMPKYLYHDSLSRDRRAAQRHAQRGYRPTHIDRWESGIDPEIGTIRRPQVTSHSPQERGYRPTHIDRWEAGVADEIGKGTVLARPDRRRHPSEVPMSEYEQYWANQTLEDVSRPVEEESVPVSVPPRASPRVSPDTSSSFSTVDREPPLNVPETLGLNAEREMGLAPMRSQADNPHIPEQYRGPEWTTDELASVRQAGEGLYQGRPSAIPALANIGVNIFAMHDARSRAKHRGRFRPHTIAPQRMDLSSMRQTAEEQARTARSSIRRQAARSGIGGAGYSTVAASSAADIGRGLAEVTAGTHVQEQAANIQARQQADMFNAQARMRAQQFEAQRDMMDEQVRRQYMDNILGTITGYGRDVIAGRQQANLAQMSSDMYDMVSSPRSRRVYDFLLGERAPRIIPSRYHQELTKKD